ncbi:MerR family transcriptional regulator [Paenibacillaceae bacterium WGS1546]|uniref:MerR family transcriptional regulator n=1 Tax=Cohnella sp. WGS1546 TaxID=3366810 RepID=UPI00372CF5DF
MTSSSAYTAQQIAELLKREDPQMNLRTVRYYTQLGVVPPLELVGNKRAYTERHLHYFRAILTLAKSGETLAEIQDRLTGMPIEEIAKLGEKLPLYRADRMLRQETRVVNEDVVVSASDRVPPGTLDRIVSAVSRILKEDSR